MSIANNSRNTKYARKTGRRAFPFRDGAPGYREREWSGIVPVSRRGTKSPLFAGITGRDGKDASLQLLAELMERYPWANIGLRLPFGIIGLDIDDYDGKGGGRTLRSLSGRLGPLSTTWRSTSRAPDDMVSGIYLFRAPRKDDWEWVTDLGTGSGVEIIQQHHRFAVVPGSLHNATGRPYRWWRGSERAEAPRPEELPLLPVPWARYLLSSRRSRASARATPAEAEEWWGRIAPGPMCSGMEKSVQDQSGKIRDAAELGGLHEALRTATFHLCQFAAEGHTGLNRALSAVEAEFMRAQRGRDLRTEWNGAANSAVIRAAAMSQETADPCRALAGIGRRRNVR